MVKIITDTTAALPPEFSKQHQIPIVPQLIHFEEESYAEGIEMSNDEFMTRLKSSKELPKTSAPPPDAFVKEFKRLVPFGEPIVCIHPSAEISGTIRAATVAAQDFPDADIRIIDTRLVASPLGSLVKLAVQWASAGESADTIESRIRDLASRSRIYFLVATLEYLARGGRIGGASALLGSVLQVKPILTLQDGRVESFEKERTMKKALGRLKSLVVEQYPQTEDGYLTIMHGDVPEQAQTLANELASELSLSNIPIFDMPPAIVTHAGPGVLGIGFFTDQA